MQGAFGAFVVALAAGIAVVIFLKHGIASFGLGRPAWPRWDISCTTNPKLYWAMIAACAAMALCATFIGLRDVFTVD
jgi:hypothetical protein